MSSDHFSPWSEPPGRVRLRLVVARCGAGDDVAAVRRRQRAGPALPPGDHRPGRGDAGRDVPGAVLGRARHRRGVQRAHHRRAWPRKDVRNARLRECVDVIRALFARRGGHATTGSSRSTAPGCGRCPTSRRRCRRGGEREDRALGRGVGRRAGDGQRAGRARCGGCSTPTGTPAAAAACLQVHVSLGADRRGGARRSRTTSGAATSSTRPSAGTSRSPEAFDAARAARRRRTWRRRSSRLAPTSARHVAWLRESPRSGFDEIYLHHVGQEQDAFIDAFGEHVLPRSELRHERSQATSDLWWKNAVVYCLDVETFCDCDGDGCGDLPRADRAHRLPRRPRRHAACG